MSPSNSLGAGRGARLGGRLLAAAALATAPAAASGPGRFYARTEVLARSEPDAIMDALDGWHGPYGPGRRQYAWSWIEAGVRDEHWGLGGLVRWDYDLRFSRDAASLYGAVQNKQALPVGRSYAVAVRAHVIHAGGLRASWRGDLAQGLEAEFGLSLLRSNYMMEGGIQGTALVTGPRAYTYNANADYAYTRDVLFDRPVAPQDGLGGSLDLAVDWRVRPDWRVRAQVRDLPGRVWWRQLPYTQANATSDRSSTDSEGFTHWAPLVSGLEANHAWFRQTLPARESVEIACTAWSLVPTLGANVQFGDWLPRVGLARTLAGWTFGATCWPTTRALGFEVGHRQWKAGLAMDNLQWGLVKTVNLSFAING